MIGEGDDARFPINFQNCVNCKTCDIKDPSRTSSGPPRKAATARITRICELERSMAQDQQSRAEGKELSRSASVAAIIVMAGIAAFIVYGILQWRGLAVSAKVLVATTTCLGQSLLLLDVMSVVELRHALGMIQDAAGTSPLIHRCGALLFRQPPGRRYPILTSGGAFLSVLLSLGAVGLLSGMIARGVERTRAVRRSVATIRTQRMTLASLRGVVSVPLWSPTSISMPLVIAGLPILSWWRIFPSGAVNAMGLLLIGWVTDRLSYARVPHRVEDAIAGGAAMLARLALSIALLPLVGGLIGHAIGISMINAILLMPPAVAIVWHGLQLPGEGNPGLLVAGLPLLLRKTLPRIDEMRSKIVIFGTSGALGALILPLIDVEALIGGIERFDLGARWLLFLGYLFIVVTSVLGVNAIVSVHPVRRRGLAVAGVRSATIGNCVDGALFVVGFIGAPLGADFAPAIAEISDQLDGTARWSKIVY